ncbi:hypothetical protein JKP88DRAFT_244687 [Tribonema minus]|uniref:Uncharacterized protein n=1 Tax=Tribonema minus TaxID=303371 RepID=A0A836CIC3_9STRA|nr:hypothetical protein JKP88DRAFT_244687 [Tribonema minus]
MVVSLGGGDCCGSGGGSSGGGDYMQGFRAAQLLFQAAASVQGQKLAASNNLMQQLEQTLAPVKEVLLRRELAEQRMRDEAGAAAHLGDKAERAINCVELQVQQQGAGVAQSMVSLAQQQGVSGQLQQMQMQSGMQQLLHGVQRETGRLSSRIDTQQQQQQQPAVMAELVREAVEATRVGRVSLAMDVATDQSNIAQRARSGQRVVQAINNPQSHMSMNPQDGVPDDAPARRSVIHKTPNDFLDYARQVEGVNDSAQTLHRKTEAAMTKPGTPDVHMDENNTRKRAADAHTFDDTQPDVQIRYNADEPKELESHKIRGKAAMQAMDTEEGVQVS